MVAVEIRPLPARTKIGALACYDPLSVTRNTFAVFADDPKYCNVIKRTNGCVSMQDIQMRFTQRNLSPIRL